MLSEEIPRNKSPTIIRGGTLTLVTKLTARANIVSSPYAYAIHDHMPTEPLERQDDEGSEGVEISRVAPFQNLLIEFLDPSCLRDPNVKR